MTGNAMMDASTAAFYAPFFDYHTAKWNRPWLEEVGIFADLLPDVVESDRVAGTLVATAAEALGLPPGIDVITGTIDTYAECEGCGVTEPGDALVVYGSTMTLLTVMHEPSFHESLWAGFHYRRNLRSLIGGMATSGLILEWFLGLISSSSGPAITDNSIVRSELESAARLLPPGAEGVMALPYFMGERTPVDDPDARGLLAGLTLHHTAAHIYRAFIEAIAFGLRHNLDELRRLGAEPTRVVATGGGTRNSLWVQIVSDVIGLPQTASNDTNAAIRGNAGMAAESTGYLGHKESLRWTASGTRYLPDAQAKERYEELYRIYRDLYPATTGVTRRLVQSARPAH